MIMANPADIKPKLGEILVQAGLITPEQLGVALREQNQSGGRIGFNLVRLDYLSASKLAAFLEHNTDITTVRDPTPERLKAAAVLPRHLALYYKIAPVHLEKGTLTVGLASIEHPNLIRALSEVTGYRIDPVIYPEAEIRAIIDGCYDIPAERGVEANPPSENIFTIIDEQKSIKALTLSQLKGEDAGEWLRSIVAVAIKEKSREILIKPGKDGSLVSFKKDTFSPSDFNLTTQIQDDLAFVLMWLSKMNPLQQHRPQHGRFLVKIQQRKIVMVVSCYPTIYGLRFLLEIFDEKLLKRSFDEVTAPFASLRFQLEEFMLRARRGMLLITGPDGSGRTSFFYSYLSLCKEEFSKIVTVENTIRYPMNGVQQRQVEETEMEPAMEGLIGEAHDLVAINSLRNLRSAELAFLIAARTPLIALLSSYDSFFSIEWLCRHGLKSAIKAGLLVTIVSPRLIQRVCPHCAVPYELTLHQKEVFQIPPDAQMKMNQGCEFCKDPENYSAELVFEFLQIDREVISWMEMDYSASALRDAARKAGRKTLFDVALQRAVYGTLDMASVMKLQPVL